MGAKLGLLIAAVLALPASGVGAPQTALSAFHTPGWSMQCVVVGEEAPPALSCETRSGLIVSMGSTSRATVTEATGPFRHDPFAAHRTLAVNGYWRFGRQFGCVNHGAELRCWNQRGRGWWLGPSRAYRIE